MSYPFSDFQQIHTSPLKERKHKTSIEAVLLSADTPLRLDEQQWEMVQRCAEQIRLARENEASVIFGYGAHLIRNGTSPFLIELAEQGWVTHFLTNGAGIIHDFEYAHIGKSTEDVEANVHKGCFGTWDETGRFIHLALLVGAIEGRGFGESVGKMIMDGGIFIPEYEKIREKMIESLDGDEYLQVVPPLAELLETLSTHYIDTGWVAVPCEWKRYSLVGNVYRLGVPLTSHPGIGYDIISCHPLFNGAAIGRGGGIDFKVFCRSMENLTDGVYCSIGSAIMSPQVFEKSLSIVNNLRHGEGLEYIKGHYILVNDLQDNEWDWSQGEPPKEHPAYYLRFCKSFSRMGGRMDYLSCDNRQLILGLHHELCRK